MSEAEVAPSAEGSGDDRDGRSCADGLTISIAHYIPAPKAI